MNREWSLKRFYWDLVSYLIYVHVYRFEEAAKNEDDAAVERLFKLFPQIGRAEEGVDLFAKYLASQV